jgi:orotidine-5'-phosphate decarboxylase
MPILVPGVGAQQGDLAGAVAAAAGEGRDQPFLVAASRSIMLASSGPDHQHAAAAAARQLRDQIQSAI